MNEGGTAFLRPLLTIKFFFFIVNSFTNREGETIARYIIKQKLWSLGEKFDIKDSYDNLAYQVTGSFFKIPKYFEISRSDGQQVAKITKVMLQFLPKFDVTLTDGRSFRIEKEFSMFRPRYKISDLGLDIQGNFWDMDFELSRDSRVVANISQEWFKLSSTYQVDVYDEAYSDVIISLVVAIDYVKAQQRASSA